jgi:hypothetical protein
LTEAARCATSRSGRSRTAASTAATRLSMVRLEGSRPGLRVARHAAVRVRASAEAAGELPL